MCDHCMKHGAGGKWYLNAKSYSEEVASKHNLREFLLEQYKNFEQISVRKVAGFSPVGNDHLFKMPIIGRIVRRTKGSCTAPGRPGTPFARKGTSARWSPWRMRWPFWKPAQRSPSSRRTACAAT